jgi:hypothetical protein
VEERSVPTDWDVQKENRKAKFMDKLYEFYGCNDGLYTGLATRFKNDIFELVRDGVAEDFASVEEVFTVFDRIAREAT